MFIWRCSRAESEEYWFNWACFPGLKEGRFPTFCEEPDYFLGPDTSTIAPLTPEVRRHDPLAAGRPWLSGEQPNQHPIRSCWSKSWKEETLGHNSGWLGFSSPKGRLFIAKQLLKWGWGGKKTGTRMINQLKYGYFYDDKRFLTWNL